MFLRLQKVTLRRAIHSWRFVGGVILLAAKNLYVFLQESSLTQWHKDQLFVISAATLFFAGILSLVFILSAVIPFSTAFMDDRNNGYTKYVCIRTSVKSYCTSLALTVVCVSGLAVFLGYILPLLLLSLFMPFASTISGVILHIQPHSVLDLVHIDPTMYIVLLLPLRVMAAALWGLVAMLVTTFIQNSFVALSTPIIIYYVLVNAGRVLPPFLSFYILQTGAWRAHEIPAVSGAISFFVLTAYVVVFLLIVIYRMQRIVRYD